MFFIAIQPEMPATAAGNLPEAANDLPLLTNTQFAATPTRTTRYTSTHGNSRTVCDHHRNDCRFVCGPGAANSAAIA
jgi:hypothetical protein